LSPLHRDAGDESHPSGRPRQNRERLGAPIELPRETRYEERRLGIRPEALHERVSMGEPTIDVQVDLVEMLGRDQLVYALWRRLQSSPASIRI